VARFEKHLASQGINLDRWSYRIGPKLAFDPKSEKFVDNAAADRMLTREYREPFVVPKNV